jgi:hypothetical protein
MDKLLPLSTFYRDCDDYNSDDTWAEINSLIARQQAISDMLDGKITPNDLLDFLEVHGIKPLDYVEAVVSSIELVIDNQIAVV